MKVNHFDTIEEENEYSLKKNKRNKKAEKIYQTVFFVIFIILIVGIYFFRRIDTFEKIVSNPDKNALIFAGVGILICVTLATVIHLISNRKKQKKFSITDFRMAITASIGIMLVGGFIFMAIKMMYF